MVANTLNTGQVVRPDAPEPRWLRLAFRIAEQLRYGTLTLQLPDGTRRTFAGPQPGPNACMQLHRMRAIRRFATGGGLGFAEAYLDGDWDSPDLQSLLALLARNQAAYEERYYGRVWYRALARFGHLLRPNSRRGSRRNILAHYDLGNRFYRLWLDRSMSYSAARFTAPDQSLEMAQGAKYRSLARLIDLQPGQRLLEIGCGWGGFAEFAVREFGARVTALTISREQHDFAKARVQAAGITEQVEVRLQDYRDVEGRFDRIAAIEMFEAVGERYWRTFFLKLGECLAPGGRAGLQVITIADRYFEEYRRGADFIQRHVFPGGILPSPGALERHIRAAGFAQIGEVTFGADYARTLAEWNRRFQRAWPEIRRQGFDQRFKRLWDYYLAYCEAGFRVGFTDVAQIALRQA
jgi:cyclopropane-fatty-acyl-phospholipid synthase